MIPMFSYDKSEDRRDRVNNLSAHACVVISK